MSNSILGKKGRECDEGFAGFGGFSCFAVGFGILRRLSAILDKVDMVWFLKESGIYRPVGSLLYNPSALLALCAAARFSA